MKTSLSFQFEAKLKRLPGRVTVIYDSWPGAYKLQHFGSLTTDINGVCGYSTKPAQSPWDSQPWKDGV